MSDRITVEGGFIIDSERLTGKVFVLTAPWENKYNKIFRQKDVIGIRLSRSAGWKGGDLAFLSELPPLKSAEVYHWETKDISPLYKQEQIEHIGLECQFGKFDFTEFPKLTHLGVTWRPSAKTLFKCMNLRYLNIGRFPYEDLEELSQLSKLERLVLLSRKLARLTGLRHLLELQELDLAFCTSLHDIASLEYADKLQILELTGCKKIGDIGAMRHLSQLKRLLMENCGVIRSVKPLASCRKLKEAYFFNTRIEDRDTSVFLDLPGYSEGCFPKSQ